MIDRRAFLLTGVAGAASTLLPTLSLAALDAEKQSQVTAWHKQWHPLLGEHFVVEEAGRSLTRLKLSELREGAKTSQVDQFHLYFTNASAVMLEERSYLLYHPELGGQDIFLQPVVQSSGSPYYRATFSLLTDNFNAVLS